MFWLFRHCRFLSTLSLRRATSLTPARMSSRLPISIHALLAESDRANSLAHAPPKISIHALLAESDFFGTVQVIIIVIFLSTLSLRRATLTLIWDVIAVITISIHALLAESDSVEHSVVQKLLDFYPRSPCGERLHALHPQILRSVISIHALLAESDRPQSGWSSYFPDFYPRSPCGERPGETKTRLRPRVFLSTLSLRRATQP